jgi:FkbM family methyltransferase
LSRLRLPLFVSVAARFLAQEPRRRDGARLAAATAVLWARGRAGLRGRPISLAATANGRRVGFTAWTYIDILVAREIFLDRDYRVPADLEARTIIDVGANTGISVRFLRSLYPSAAIVAAEPDPANFERLEANTSGDESTRLVQAAVGLEPGRTTFYPGKEGWASSLEPQPDSRPIDVDLVTVADLLAQVGAPQADLLKVDIEGAEWPLLEGGTLQGASNCLIGELHFADGRTLADAERLLAGFDVTFHRKNETAACFTARRRPAPVR